MEAKCKVILGQKRPDEFSRYEGEFTIKAYLNTSCTKRWIWRKYTGQVEVKREFIGLDTSVKV